MEDVIVYIIPSNDTTIVGNATIQIQLSYFSEDKACNGFLNSDYLMQCSKYKIEPCIMTPDCYSICGELDCFKGEDEAVFHSIVVPKDIPLDSA